MSDSTVAIYSYFVSQDDVICSIVLYEPQPNYGRYSDLIKERQIYISTRRLQFKTMTRAITYCKIMLFSPRLPLITHQIFPSNV